MNNKSSETGYLRLISSNQSGRDDCFDWEPHTSLEGRGASNQWDVLVLVSESELFDGKFSDFARRFRPECILDFRGAPRLDLLAGSRIKAFKLFDELGVKYLDVAGRLGVDVIDHVALSSSDLVDFLRSHRRCPDGGDRLTAIFFDNDQALLECKKILGSINSESANEGGKEIKVSQYKAGLLAM